MVNSESASNFDGRGQSYFIHGNLALNSTKQLPNFPTANLDQ